MEKYISQNEKRAKKTKTYNNDKWTNISQGKKLHH